MISPSRAALLAGFGAALAACGLEVRLPGIPSPAPVPQGGGFQAGFGRADITPPPKVGLSGNGPEGREARGYRTRLYARALLLQDSAGSRLALVVVDMPHTSLLLQRQVARRLLDAGLGIGVDRLLLSATHTHSGPGHHYDAFFFNQVTSEVTGYDSLLTDSLATRIARAVMRADSNLRPARLAWGTREVWGLTRIRSMAARTRNVPPPALLGTPPAGLPPEKTAVDPRLTMLRVDLYDSLAKAFVPTGAYSIFAVHGTGNSAVTELFDADVQGPAERGLEAHVNRLRAELGARPDGAVHVLANGTEGDTSPDWPPDSRCPPPEMRPRDDPGGPFAPRAWDWEPVRESAANHCIASARRAVRYVGEGIADAANALFDSLRPAPVSWSLQRAFRTVDFKREGKELGVCDEPFTGTSTVAGAADSRSRLYRHRLLGLFNAGFEEGEAATDRERSDCQGVKRLLLGPTLEHLFVARGLPRYGQFGVYRIGDMILAGAPFEVTTESGQRIERAIHEARGPDDPVEVRVVSISNGFLYYLTTAEEYTAQTYEGGATLFGPGSAAMVARVSARLAGELTADSLPRGPDTVIAKPGKPKEVMPRMSTGGETVEPSMDRPTCQGDTVVVRFTRGREGEWLPDGEPVITFARAGRPDSVVAVDDDAAVEVWSLGRRGPLMRWQARWVPPARGAWVTALARRPRDHQPSVTCGRE